jgi:hypothetical protein
VAVRHFGRYARGRRRTRSEWTRRRSFALRTRSWIGSGRFSAPFTLTPMERPRSQSETVCSWIGVRGTCLAAG